MATAAATDALQDPFSPPSQQASYEASLKPSATTTLAALHRPTFTQILSTADLSRALSGRPNGANDDYADGGEGEDLGEGIDLPVAPPISHSLLSDPDFNPSDFLLARRHTPLDDLRAELREYLASLRQSLVGVINDEYEAFIGLSLGLKHANVLQSLARVRKPVLEIRGQVVRVQEELGGMQGEMQGLLEQRKEAREAKALMRRLLATEEAVDKVEGLLGLSQTHELESRGANGRAPKTRRSTLSVSDSPTKRLERIASEFTHMQYLVDRAGPELPFIRSLEPRIAKISQALQAELADLLSSVLAARPNPNSTSSPSHYRQELTTTLRTFLSLDLVKEAEEIIRKELVKPFVARTVTRDAISSKPLPPSPLDGSSRETQPSLTVDEAIVPAPYRIELLPSSTSTPKDGTNLAPLTELYNRLLAFVSNECGILLDVTERVLEVAPGRNGGTNALVAARKGNRRVGPGGDLSDSVTSITESVQGGEATGEAPEAGVQGFQVLNRVVVDEVARAVMNELGGVIFAAGRPTVFHQHYCLTSLFLSRLESLSPSLSRLDALRAHPTFTSFQKRFQLAVYFQLRLKEAVTSIERAFEMGSASGGGARDTATASSGEGAAKEDGFVMSESEAVWRALERCWDEEVWLAELAGRFWRLTLQILSRYRTWLNDKVPRYVLPTSASSANLTAESDRDRAGRLTPNPSTPRPGTPSQSESDAVSEETTLRQLTVLIADARTMQRRARKLFDGRMRAKLPNAEEPSLIAESEDAEGAAIDEALAGVVSFVPSLSSQIITILVKRCAENLKLVRSVASQVRASTRKGPIEPSYFVHNILKELKAYLTGPGRAVEDELKRKWATAVVEDIATRYTGILSTQKKTEDSLRWLKKGRQGLSFFGRAASSATAGTGEEEDDRVKMQMQLDVDTLAQDAVALQVDVESSEAFQALKRAAKGDVPKEDEGKK